MYGNGAAMGMDRIITKAAPHQIPKALHRGRATCAAAVAGTTVGRVAVRHVATPSSRAPATTAWASALFPPNKQVFFRDHSMPDSGFHLVGIMKRIIATLKPFLGSPAMKSYSHSTTFYS